MSKEKIYCKKCGARVVPENGECPRCGYQFEGEKNKLLIAALVIIFFIVLIWLLL